MGKSGAKIRADKGKTKTYCLTREQLEACERAAVEAYKKQEEQLRAVKVMDAVREEFERKEAEFKQTQREYYQQLQEEFFSGDFNENFLNFMSYFFSISCRVLVEQFGWKPIKPHRTTRTERYASALAREMDMIIEDPNMNVQTYAEEADRLYGFRFTRN